MGDMRSQIAACRLGTRRLDELFERYGRDTIDAALKQIFDETETKCRHVVEQLKDGVYEAEAFWDHDGVNKGDKVRIHAKVTVAGGKMTIDLSGCSGERKSGINSRTYAAAYVAYKSLTAPLEPVNEGSFRALEVIIPEGNIMMARYPAPMASWSMIVPAVVDTIVSAVAPAMRDRVPAAHHGMLGGTVVFVGRDQRTNRMTVLQSIEGGGWGGRPMEDGEAATVSVCQGDVRNATIEGMELKCPVIVEQRALRADSGGPGKHRGGLGLDLRVRNLVEGSWHLPASQRTSSPPRGLWGGKPGQIDGYYLKQPNEKDFRLMDSHRHLSPADSVASVRTAGGGGWGNPLERDPEKVRWDVIEGFVSAEAAKTEYGVILKADQTVDQPATAELRNRLAKSAGRASAAE
jgi:N-methylhydantoinase B